MNTLNKIKIYGTEYNLGSTGGSSLTSVSETSTATTVTNTNINLNATNVNLNGSNVKVNGTAVSLNGHTHSLYLVKGDTVTIGGTTLTESQLTALIALLSKEPSGGGSDDDDDDEKETDTKIYSLTNDQLKLYTNVVNMDTNKGGFALYVASNRAYIYIPVSTTGFTNMPIADSDATVTASGFKTRLPSYESTITCISIPTLCKKVSVKWSNLNYEMGISIRDPYKVPGDNKFLGDTGWVGTGNVSIDTTLWSYDPEHPYWLTIAIRTPNNNDVSDITLDTIGFEGITFEYWTAQDFGCEFIAYTLTSTDESTGGMLSTQGMAIYDKYMFMFNYKNKFIIWDMNNNACVLNATFVYDANGNTIYGDQYHCNNVDFSTIKYSDSDTFPLIYASMENASIHSTYVYRISGTPGSCTISLVLTITYPAPADINHYYQNGIIDPYNSKIYVFGYTENCYKLRDSATNVNKCIVYPLPSVTAGDVTYTLSDAEENGIHLLTENLDTLLGGVVIKGNYYTKTSSKDTNAEYDNGYYLVLCAGSDAYTASDGTIYPITGDKIVIFRLSDFSYTKFKFEDYNIYINEPEDIGVYNNNLYMMESYDSDIKKLHKLTLPIPINGITVTSSATSSSSSSSSDSSSSSSSDSTITLDYTKCTYTDSLTITNTTTGESATVNSTNTTATLGVSEGDYLKLSSTKSSSAPGSYGEYFIGSGIGSYDNGCVHTVTSDDLGTTAYVYWG